MPAADVRDEDLMTPGEVAALFRVSPRVVIWWAETGKLDPATRTPGGHRRYRRSDVHALYDNGGKPHAAAQAGAA